MERKNKHQIKKKQVVERRLLNIEPNDNIPHTTVKIRFMITDIVEVCTLRETKNINIKLYDYKLNTEIHSRSIIMDVIE